MVDYMTPNYNAMFCVLSTAVYISTLYIIVYSHTYLFWYSALLVKYDWIGMFPKCFINTQCVDRASSGLSRILRCGYSERVLDKCDTH